MNEECKDRVCDLIFFLAMFPNNNVMYAKPFVR